MLHPKYVNVFAFSNAVLPVTIKLLTETCPSHAIITLDFSADTSIPLQCNTLFNSL
jgi:hypothetical protein